MIIIKLGGSVISDKTKPFSVRKSTIEHLGEQIKTIFKKVKEPIILVHGGGSFGHPTAKKYGLSSAIETFEKNYWESKDASQHEDLLQTTRGLGETHYSMQQLNQLIWQILSDRGLPVCSFQASSMFLYPDGFSDISLKIIQGFIEMGGIPLLYGDILIGSKLSYGILSGDVIISQLCIHFSSLSKINKLYSISRVIFLIDQPGILINPDAIENDSEILRNLRIKDLSGVWKMETSKRIDVTEGFGGKIDNIKKIVNLGIPVRIMSGFERNSLVDSIILEKEKGTLISGN